MAYATINQLKQEVGIDLADTSQDAYLQNLLDWLSDWIDTYTKRHFATDPVTVTNEVHDLADDNKVWLDNTDIKSVTAVNFGQTSPFTLLDTTSYVWNKLGRLIIYVVPNSFGFNLPQNLASDYFTKDSVRVSYTYGGDGVPKAIEGACVEAAAKVYRNTNVNDEEIGDYKIRYNRLGPEDVFGDMGVLDAYRIRGV